MPVHRHRAAHHGNPSTAVVADRVEKAAVQHPAIQLQRAPVGDLHHAHAVVATLRLAPDGAAVTVSEAEEPSMLTKVPEPSFPRSVPLSSVTESFSIRGLHPGPSEVDTLPLPAVSSMVNVPPSTWITAWAVGSLPADSVWPLRSSVTLPVLMVMHSATS